jgi:hypothetical protein
MCERKSGLWEALAGDIGNMMLSNDEFSNNNFFPMLTTSFTTLTWEITSTMPLPPLLLKLHCM